MSMWMRVVLENGAPTDHLFAGREEQFGNGQSIPRHLPQLDEAAHALGLPSPFDFTVDLNTVDDTVEPPWFSPTDGLACVRGLLRYLDEAGGRDLRRMFDESLEGRLLGPEVPADWPDVLAFAVVAGVAADLRTFETELTFAQEQQVRFHFQLSY